jgi:hypothetical protein
MQENNLENGQMEIGFIDRPFDHVDGGFYDGRGFYCTPEGSFWDENGTYFNKEGRDKNGGFYDEWGVYNPGEGWNYDYNCYENEIGMANKDYSREYAETILNDLKDEYDQYEDWFKNPDGDREEIGIANYEEKIFGEYIQNNLINNPSVNHTPLKNENTNNNFIFKSADSNNNSNSNGMMMQSKYMNNLNFN